MTTVGEHVFSLLVFLIIKVSVYIHNKDKNSFPFERRKRQHLLHYYHVWSLDQSQQATDIRIGSPSFHVSFLMQSLSNVVAANALRPEEAGADRRSWIFLPDMIVSILPWKHRNIDGFCWDKLIFWHRSAPLVLLLRVSPAHRAVHQTQTVAAK